MQINYLKFQYYSAIEDLHEYRNLQGNLACIIEKKNQKSAQVQAINFIIKQEASRQPAFIINYQ